MAALLAGIAMLVITATSWWLINQQHADSLLSLAEKDATLQATTVGNELGAVAARMSEITKEGLIANALFDDSNLQRLLIPYISSISSVRGIPVNILITDFKGREIASNGNGKFGEQDLNWLKENLSAAKSVSRLQLGDRGQELIAAEFIVLSPPNSADGAILYKIDLASLDLPKSVRLVHGKESRQLLSSQTAGFAALVVPPVFKNLDLAVLTSLNFSSKKDDLQILGTFLAMAVGMVFAVIILGQHSAKRLTRDLLGLQIFARDVSEKGFGVVRYERGESQEVSSLAQSINRMLDRLTQQHDKLSASEERFRSLFENAEVGINIRDADNHYLDVNPAFARMLGYSKEELLGMNFLAITHPDYVETGLVLVTNVLTGKLDHFQTEKKFIRKDGSTLWADVTVSVVRDADGNFVCFIGVAQDISARKQAQDEILTLNATLEKRVKERTAELEASNRDLQEFTQSVAHDLRQPFIAIGGFSGLLERSVQDESAMHYIERIKAGVRQAGELTDGLLALASLSRVELRLQEVDLGALATDVIDKLQQKTPARACQIHIEPGMRSQADATLIRQVLEELLDNAWKYSSRRACAEISFKRVAAEANMPDGATVYVVSDNGVGFEMAHADKLFRSFQRLHSPQEFPGTGGDLAKVQRIVARHGGRIWAKSSPGEGASFYFTLGSSHL